ncbi:MAG: NAD(P)(+) transhydrogenase (Re/Si-specific) subunit alpha, partial [Pseudolabrys sp.]
MKIVIAAEADPSEPRVSGTPETVKKLKALGAEVCVARGAGTASGILDAD